MPRLSRFRSLELGLQAVVTADLLSPAWRNRVKPGDHPTTGHCYCLAEAAWWLLGGSGSGFVPQVISGVDEEGPWTHWFLRHRQTGEMVDPSAEQFPDGPPYHLARGCGFLTKTPSKRANEIMRRYQQKEAA